MVNSSKYVLTYLAILLLFIEAKQTILDINLLKHSDYFVLGTVLLCLIWNASSTRRGTGEGFPGLELDISKQKSSFKSELCRASGLTMSFSNCSYLNFEYL